MRADAKWLGAEDIAGLGDVEVEIECCKKNYDLVFESGRTKKEQFSLKFKDHKKELLLTLYKRIPLIRAWGVETSKWVGKKIVLYVDYNVPKPGHPGQMTWGVRVKIPEGQK